MNDTTHIYPHAELMKITADDYMVGVSVWRETTEEVYHDMLNVLPPALWSGSDCVVSVRLTLTTQMDALCGNSSCAVQAIIFHYLAPHTTTETGFFPNVPV